MHKKSTLLGLCALAFSLFFYVKVDSYVARKQFDDSNSQLVLIPLDPSTVSSSSVNRNGLVERKFRIKNIGDKATVYVVSRSCTCVDVSIDAEEVDHNGVCTVTALIRYDGVSDSHRSKVHIGVARQGMPEERLLIPVNVIFVKDLAAEPDFVQFAEDDPLRPVLLRINERMSRAAGGSSQGLQVDSCPSWIEMTGIEGEHLLAVPGEGVIQHCFELVLTELANDGESTLGWIRLTSGAQELEIACVRPRRRR